MASIAARVEGIKREPALLIDASAVERACAEAGRSWRDRVLGPTATLEAMAVQMLHGNASIAHLARLMGGRFSESAYCQARARLPVAAARAALGSFAQRTRHGDDDGRWKGHRAVLIDGTGVSVPDTPALRAAFGTAGGVAEGCGLPCMTMLAVFRAGDGALLDLHLDRASTRDTKHARELHAALRPGDVQVGDRGVCAYIHLAELAALGVHGLFRMQACRAMPFPARIGERRRFGYGRHRHSEPILVEWIAEGDQVVEIVKPHNRPTHMTPEAFAQIPGTLVVRALRYTINQPGFRPREITLLTTLTDAEAYPAADLAELYKGRWRVETNLRHLKRTLGLDRLRCQSVEGVARETLVLALVYNAACAARADAAARQGQPPTRLSFIDALRAIVVALDAGRTTPADPLRFPDPPHVKAVPLRPPRIQPRRLKRAHSHFPVMTKPRAAYRQWVLSTCSAAI